MLLIGLLIGAGAGAVATWLLVARPFSTPPAQETSTAAAIEQAPDAETLSGQVTLDSDGRFVDGDDGATAILGPQTPDGTGKGLARLRLLALKLDPSDGTGQHSFEYDGYRVEVGLSCIADGRIAVQLAASAIPAVAVPDQAVIAGILEEAPIGVARIDAGGKILGHNRFLAEWLGRGGRNSMIGTDFLSLVNERDRSRVTEGVSGSEAAALEGGAIEAAIGADEEERFASLYLRRRGDSDEVVVYAVDNTEQRMLETQFAQSQKMQAVGQLAGGVAHDFNNLLTAMTGYCDLLLQRHRAGDQSFADVMQIKQNANRAANLVRQLLAFSRQQTLIPRVLDLTEAISDLSHLLRRLIGETTTLDVVYGRDLKPVKVDPGQLEQVIINLAVNARDAMPNGGQISMHTSVTSTVKPLRQGDEVMPPGEYVLIEVIDSGSGIERELQARIFEPFFTTKEVGQGTGLGLSTAFGIVKQFGGYMFVDSTLGVGTTFSIYLPAWNGEIDASASTGDTRTDADLTGTGTVLLVEDEDPVRLFAARALRGKGYTVIEARSGEAALDLIDAEQPGLDLMVTDVMMPGMDGPALIRKIREDRPTLPVVCISGYSEDALRQRIADTESVAFLPKPFSLKQLAQAVKLATTEADASV